MIVFLLIWLALLTVGAGIGLVMIVGKFAQLEREHTEVFENLAGGIEEIHGVINGFLEDFQALKTQVETLSKTDENPPLWSEPFSQLEARIDNLAESHTALDKKLTVLLNADIEHLVLEPAKNKGGRPRKVGV